jgi:competence protein ComEC
MLAWLAVPVRPGWPPHGWVLVMCDVGQGDGVVLRAGDGLAVVVDVGPDPPLIDRCLSRLGVNRVALVILTHPHADHIGGLAGVSSGRRVDIVAIGPGASGDPAMADVLRWADAADADVQELSYATTQRLGDLSWTVLGPLPGFETDPAAPEPSEDAEGAESGDVNDTSVVLRADVRGVSMLLTGDIEPTAQQALRAWGPALAVDVLKVPHHGSRHQDADFLRDAEAELAVISAGEDNAYGHPAIETLHLLEDSGTPVLRTDLLGDVAVVVNESGALGYVGS